MNINEFFGNKVKEIREEQNVSIKELAAKINKSVIYLKGLEQGNRKVRITTVFAICEALKTEPYILFENFK